MILNQYLNENIAIYNADCIEFMNDMLPDNSVGYSIFSPPYGTLYTYSNSDRDIGNCRDDAEFYQHFKFVIDGLLRVLKPGRLCSVDVMNLSHTKGRDGFIGLKDFRGAVIRQFIDAGFIFHSEHVVWKDPLIEATRTKALGLLHKQLCKDSTMSRAGTPQYLLTFRKPGENLEPVKHEHGLTYFIGDDAPTEGNLSHQYWRKYASPVWMDVRFTRTLNYRGGRDDEDERHICPMALDIIERGIELWSNPGDIVFDPFGGIGSTVYSAVNMRRKGISCELKPSYYEMSVNNMSGVRKFIDNETFEIYQAFDDQPNATEII